jgi:hypothetical protein
MSRPKLPFPQLHYGDRVEVRFGPPFRAAPSPSALRRRLRAVDERARKDPLTRARILTAADEYGIRVPDGLVSTRVLAALCGVHVRTYQRWVTGERPCTLAAVRLLELLAGGVVR